MTLINDVGENFEGADPFPLRDAKGAKMQNSPNITANIRRVRPDDVEPLQKLYAYYVNNTTVSFETEAPTLQEFQARVDEISKDFPYLVCELDGKILGYAYAHRAFQRQAYAWCAETTIYVDPHAQGHGVARALYTALIELLKTQGYKNLYAVIVAENLQSSYFHMKQGFTLFSVFKKAGWKLGRWLDVAWFELLLPPYDQEPVEPSPISMFSDYYIASVCRDAAKLVKAKKE
ncbi:MAG: GNAT family N-acetyltransferase [Planctomycetia bacterium]|nr:GNAT family N-acetyltransferase [Planctomycetia bacterium]